MTRPTKPAPALSEWGRLGAALRVAKQTPERRREIARAAARARWRKAPPRASAELLDRLHPKIADEVRLREAFAARCPWCGLPPSAYPGRYGAGQPGDEPLTSPDPEE